jgi:hypothetical protein
MARPERVKEVILSQRVRKYLGLRSELEATVPSLIFVEQRRKGYQIVIEITKTPDERGSFLNLAVFDEGRYSLTWSEDLEEYAQAKFDYLKGLLGRPEWGLTFDEAPAENARSLADWVQDDFRGKASKAVLSLGLPILGLYVFAIVIPILAGIMGLIPNDVGFGIGLTNLVIVAADVRRKRLQD